MIAERSPLRFADRQDAGAVLATRLRHYAGRSDVIVLGLPRGGVPIAAAIARTIGARLDVLVVRKIGVPNHRELAMGAIASGGTLILNTDLISELHISDGAVQRVIEEERQELARRERLYRGNRPALDLARQVVVIADDGLATGSTMAAAVRAVRAAGPARVVVAVPVGSDEACRAVALVADEVVCARIPRPFSAVGQWYLDFSETSDAEVKALLRDSAPQAAGATS